MKHDSTELFSNYVQECVDEIDKIVDLLLTKREQGLIVESVTLYLYKAYLYGKQNAWWIEQEQENRRRSYEGD